MPLNMETVLLDGKAQMDGWYNAMTGIGTAKDKRENSTFQYGTVLDDSTLVNLYESEGLATGIVNTPVSDMTREWFYIEADPENYIINYLSSLCAKKAVKEALTWGDLFGGAMIFIGVNDGLSSEKPVNEANIKSIDYLEVYDKRNISFQPDNFYKDKRKPNFGKPEIYEINNPSMGSYFKVHETRLLRFDGALLPKTERNQRQGWGGSVLQKAYTRLRDVCDSLSGVANINTEFIMGVLKITNLQQLLASKEGQKALHDRIEVMDMVKSMLNTIVLDKNEEYERVTSIGVSGLRDLVDILIDVLCGVSRIPRMRLLGDQSKGLGGGADGTIRMYYDDISDRQEIDLLPQMIRLCKYVSMAKDCECKLTPKQVIPKFRPLWQMSSKEEAEVKLINAKSDGVYIDHGLPVEYVLTSRFGGQSYGSDLTLPQEYVKAIEAKKPEELIAKAERLLEPVTPGSKEPGYNGVANGKKDDE